jgi:hypothetical protein
MIIVITMTGIITGITVSSVRGAQKRAQLKDGVNTFIDSFQTAKFRALGNLAVDTGSDVCPAEGFFAGVFPSSDIPQEIHVIAILEPDCYNLGVPPYPPMGYAVSVLEMPNAIEVIPVENTMFMGYETPNGDFNFEMDPPLGEFDIPPSELNFVVSARDGTLSQNLVINTFSGIIQVQ